MASVVDICNLALSMLGAQNIASLTEGSTEARAANQFYALSRDELLASYPWGFAQNQITLAEIINDKAGNWGFAYQVPVDCLKIGLVRPPYGAEALIDEGGLARMAFAYSLEAGKIYCDIERALLLYTARVEDSGLYPPLFVDALAGKIGSRLAMSLTKSMELQGRLVQLAQMSVSAAMAGDANQTAHFYDDGLGILEAQSTRGGEW